MFLEFHSKVNGDAVFLNVDHISSVRSRRDGGAEIFVSNGVPFLVKEDYTSVITDVEAAADAPKA